MHYRRPESAALVVPTAAPPTTQPREAYWHPRRRYPFPPAPTHLAYRADVIPMLDNQAAHCLGAYLGAWPGIRANRQVRPLMGTVAPCSMVITPFSPQSPGAEA